MPHYNVFGANAVLLVLPNQVRSFLKATKPIGPITRHAHCACERRTGQRVTISCLLATVSRILLQLIAYVRYIGNIAHEYSHGCVTQATRTPEEGGRG
jgi:hypothetical protein